MLITIDPRILTEEEREEFLAGYNRVGGYTEDVADGCGYVFCAPWDWETRIVVEAKNDTPYAIGAAWAAYVDAHYSDYFEEEEED